ncbi:MAG TPA: tryptophan--tRNA ligase [Gaiellales bacterium]
MPTTNARFDAVATRDGALQHAVQRDPGSFRILTGDRPTGPLHIGHLFGTLENRVRLQDLGVELLVLIADYQTITDRVAQVQLPRDVEGLVADYLAVGIDPERAIVFTHSQVPELNQLLLPFLSLISVAELGRNPTVKDEIATTGGGATSALMFSYPAHQAADILFCRANLVPVGKDQLPHLELTRTIARRFNERYSPAVPYFPEPEALLSRTPLLLGVDGRKMSKSRGNSIPLAATDDETARLIRGAKTDSERRITYEPGRRPEVANLLEIASLSLGRPAAEIADELGDAGSSALKQLAVDALNEHLRPIRRRRDELAREPDHLRAVLRRGNARAREIARGTLDDVQELMHTTY